MTLISHKKISQDVKVLVYQYPFASKVNKDLHKLILEKATPGDRNPNTGRVHMTSWSSFDEFKIISQWAKQIVDGFGGKLNPLDVDTNLPPTNIKVSNLWAQWYDIERYVPSYIIKKINDLDIP